MAVAEKEAAGVFAGGLVVALLSPGKGLAGVVAYYLVGGAQLGPAWYAFSIPLEAIPCVWLGARLGLAGRRAEHAPAPGASAS